MKKISILRPLALLLIVAMMISTFSVSALAETTEQVDTPTQEEIIVPDEGDEDDAENDAYANYVDVSSSAELEAALGQGQQAIRIIADFAIDRTFYVVSDAIIYSEQAHTLTRDPNFGSDVFVVGEYEDGTVCEETVTLQLGHDESETADMLVIDGNSANMTAQVQGSVVFAGSNAVVNMYHNVTVKNCVKTGNLRTLDEKYELSYTNRIGGAVLISARATVNIYGGTYSDNGVNTDITENTEMDSTQGGAFYFFGPANIYGGRFENNSAYRGGAFYVYRTLTISGGTVSGNYASDRGGALYMAASTQAYLNIEGDTDSEGLILFKNNKADLYGGALYCQGVSVAINNATFDGNTSANNGGAVYVIIASEEVTDVKMTVTDSTFKNNITDYNGGAVYMTGTNVYYENVTFESNTALATANSSDKRYGGGALYGTGSFVDINGANFIGNHSDYNGGAVELYSESTAVMNNITTSNNTADMGGGFLYANNSDTKLYNSAIRDNKAGGAGGAIYVTSGAALEAYVTTFENNTSVSNGGAMYLYTGASQENILHSCAFVGNESDNFGGAFYISAASVLNAYNTSAKANKAYRGGFMYETTTGTLVTLNGLTVSQNTASDAGPIIYGNTTNATLVLNKTTYIDVDSTAALDDAYWEQAIVNKLTVTETTDSIPGFIDYGDTEETPPESIINRNITNIVELQAALAAKLPEITIISEFMLDRTLYITSDIVINVSGNRTLTRRADFGGDIFVIGENADGELCEEEVSVSIKPIDTESSLTINGNSESMTADVVGTVFFVGKSGNLELHEGLTVTNCNKVGNERTLNEVYGLSYTNEIGGAVAIIAGGTMDIHGGNYSNNTVNDETDGDATSSRGGAIYAFGNVNIYGGTFSNNHAHRGGALYVYRTMNIHNATIEGNTAYVGGAVYIPASTVAYLYLGGASGKADGNVVFKNNQSTSSGGAIYASGKLLQAENTKFTANTSGAHGGSVFLNASSDSLSDAKMIVKDSLFQENTTTNNGGAVYITGSCAHFSNTDFVSNHSNSTSYGGGAVYSTGSYSKFESVRFTNNSSDFNGGGLALYSSSEAVLYNVTADGNSAVNTGGFLFNKSTATIYNSNFKNNHSGNGGAINMVNPAVTSIYDTDFTGNSAVNNGGAMYVYTDGTNTLLHDCSFIKNTADNYGGAIYVSKASILDMYNTVAKQNDAKNGGFMYQTTSKTTVTINGLTVSGNTADAGPIIYGNTTLATLNLNKSNYVDETTDTLDDAYWETAIANKLTVVDISDEIPIYNEYGNEDYSNLKGYVSVSSAEELEAALESKESIIRVVSDFTIDRTLFVTSDTTIFATTPYRLTRAQDFGGDLFVVGDSAKGSSPLLSGNPPKLTLGNPASTTENLLIIDGNKNAMEVEVVGSLFFVCNSATVDVYNNASIVNAYKSGNERITMTKFSFTNTKGIGGAAFLLESGTLNIYGGLISNHAVNDQSDSSVPVEEANGSTYGGAIYNRGSLNIYGGTFEYNRGARGGIIYNLRMTHVYGGTFRNNYAFIYGGIFYMAGSEYSTTYIGSQDGESQVLMQNNVAEKRGGAIYSSALASTIVYGNTTFDGNQSYNGGAIYANGVLLSNNATYTNNQAENSGGAVFLSNTSSTLVTRRTSFDNSTFQSNQAKNGGAIYATASSSAFDHGAIFTVNDSSFESNSVKNNGGALYMYNKANATLNNVSFLDNTATVEGGAVYMGYESKMNIQDSEFQSNHAVSETKSYGGAMSIHSSDVTANNVQFLENQAYTRGGAIYISYTTASGRDSLVYLTNCPFTNNYSASYGGAIYATDRNRNTDPEAEPEKDRTLYIFDTTFENNYTDNKGGAVCLNSRSNAYMRNVTFNGNKTTGEQVSGHNAGAIYMAGSSTLEINGGIFTENEAGANAGGIGMYSGSEAILNNITATGNYAHNSSGFMILDTAYATVYNSTFKGNSCRLTGGAISTVDLSTLDIYNSTFDGNSAQNGGGALYIYQGAVQVTIHSSTFKNNVSDNYGGAIYISNKSLLDLYNITATGNSAYRGGFIYATTGSGKAYIDLIGVTLDSNTATDAGPIIYGNTTNAVLNLNKDLYTDLQVTDLDETYWATALVNKLTVNDISDTVTEAPLYEDSYEDEQTPPASTSKPILVEPVLALAENSSDAVIDSKYGALPKLDNSSNFMSKGTTTFENINNSTVTVDSFVYHEGDPSGNGNVGEALLIYQAIMYKKAFPDENVKIAISSFRFSTSAAVCINRNSRYFGYMRALYSSNYDNYGFVRVSYLLLVAASMGIDVTVVGQLDGNPNSSATPPLSRYFTEQLNTPCDPDYTDGVIGDYMKFRLCEWTSYDNKAGSDMMHTKMCAVSHYLDKDGNVHKNAVWSSSSNLDGIKSGGINGVDKLQTATIVSDHEELYRTADNYLKLISNYCRQEEVYLFRDIAVTRSTQQIDLILSGRGDEIASDEQIVYLGTENDEVFELYFAPFGGDLSTWSEAYNPFVKYLRAMQNSEDSIILTWNNVKFAPYPLRDRLQELIIDAFHKNADPNNQIYVNLPTFDTAAFDDLVVGEDIGFKSFNTYDCGGIHSKDLQVSYTENGQRYYVSLLNSMNIHTGSMAYQSNFALVIKETDCDEDSVFFTIADETTKGIVEHAYDYSEEKEYIPETMEDGYKYYPCLNCDKILITEIIHRESSWITDKKATTAENGIRHRNCLDCGILLQTQEYSVSQEQSTLYLGNSDSRTFTSRVEDDQKLQLSKTPHTIEATIHLPKDYNDRAGVILGNYDANRLNRLNFEIYTMGRVRLFLTNNGQNYDCIFNTDIRSDDPVHIALTVDGTVATLYVNDKEAETKELPFELPTLTNEYIIGGDARGGNLVYFKGSIYSVNLFSDVRTSEEIKRDKVAVHTNEDALLNSKYFTTNSTSAISCVPSGKTFTQSSQYELGSLTQAPLTIEAVVQLPQSQTDRAGVILGNYDATGINRLNLEVYSMGKLRLFYTNNGQTNDCIFDADIRSDKPVHVAVVVDNLVATAYINGVAEDSITLSCPLPSSLENLKIGSDNRSENTQYFKGSIYSVNLFGDARTAEEIESDVVLVSGNEDNILYSKNFAINNSDSDSISSTPATFNYTTIHDLGTLSSTPQTFEAKVRVPEDYDNRVGVILGNYDAKSINRLNVEIYTKGRVRLFLTNNGQNYDCIFNTDVRSKNPVHIALTVDGTVATLYVNGKFAETKELPFGLPTLTNEYKIGGDARDGNLVYFKGGIYSVNLFDDVRTPEEILKDMSYVSKDTENLISSTYFVTDNNAEKVEELVITGKEFTSSTSVAINENLKAAPQTFEATVHVPKDFDERAGVVLGNYDEKSLDRLNFEIYTMGRVRLFITNNGQNYDCIFNTDVRSDEPVHLALTVDGTIATLYVNSKLAETKELPFGLPTITDGYKIGGDDRAGNIVYFRGSIYSVNLFSDARTAEQIKNDMVVADSKDEALLCSATFAKDVCEFFGHKESDATVDFDATTEASGLSHTECLECGKMLVSSKTPAINVVETRDFENIIGLTTDVQSGGYVIGETLSSAPHTFEALIQLDKSYNQRAGVIIGNYDASMNDQINFEVYTYGKPRLFYRTGGVAYTYNFKTDIRSDSLTHVALTVDGLTAYLYVNGELAETVALAAELPANALDGYVVGSDNRAGNAQHFKGTIYDACMFSDARTAEEIAVDRYLPASDSDGLLFAESFLTTDETIPQK